MSRLAESELRKQALWLVGVLTALAIKEAIGHSHAVFFNRDEPCHWLMGLVRLIMFLPSASASISARFTTSLRPSRRPHVSTSCEVRELARI